MRGVDLSVHQRQPRMANSCHALDIPSDFQSQCPPHVPQHKHYHLPKAFVYPSQTKGQKSLTSHRIKGQLTIHRHLIERLLRGTFAFIISASRDRKQQQLDVEAARMISTRHQLPRSSQDLRVGAQALPASSSGVQVEAAMHARVSGLASLILHNAASSIASELLSICCITASYKNGLHRAAMGSKACL